MSFSLKSDASKEQSIEANESRRKASLVRLLSNITFANGEANNSQRIGGGTTTTTEGGGGGGGGTAMKGRILPVSACLSEFTKTKSASSRTSFVNATMTTPQTTTTPPKEYGSTLEESSPGGYFSSIFSCFSYYYGYFRKQKYQFFFS
jgi:hypothetical protein